MLLHKHTPKFYVLFIRQPKSNEEGDEMFAKDQKAVSLPAAHRHKFKAASTTEKVHSTMCSVISATNKLRVSFVSDD